MITSFLASDAQASESAPVGTVLGNKNLSAEVISLQPLIRKYATEKGIPDEVPFLSAIMMVESRGIEQIQCKVRVSGHGSKRD